MGQREFRQAMVNFATDIDLRRYKEKYVHDVPKVLPLMTELIVVQPSELSLQVLLFLGLSRTSTNLST